MVRPAQGALASAPLARDARDLFGWDRTPCIVAVEADDNGRARVWQRQGARVELTEHHFSNWFLTTNLDLLAHLPARQMSAEWLRNAKAQPALDEPLAVVELDAGDFSDDAYRYLVLTNDLREVETALVETANKRDGDEAQNLSDLRGLVLIWDPVEQFLTLTGRTFFKEMSFDALLRLQFDLETTGLDEDRDRIFMISMRDSTGWRECLDTSSTSEADLLRRFVDLVQERDPDTLENHNIFGFDLSFLAKRAGRLGVDLALGRDRSEPYLQSDVFDSGERPEPFLRWRVAGRQVIDTQHAVRRYGLAAPDMRRHGLKEAARYFGLARTDREYVPGAEIWATYRVDPARVRRYAADDVDEVDSLSRRLLPSAFGLASLLPRSYERVAADTGTASLWELALVRAYLHAGRAISAPRPRLQRASASRYAELFVTGVVGPTVLATARRLLPSVLAERSITSANDDLSVLPRMLSAALQDRDNPGSDLLASAAHAYLASPGLFADPRAADGASAYGHEHVDRILAELRDRGCELIEVDGESVTFGVPPVWTSDTEKAVAKAASAYLPDGVELQFDGHFDALYARAPGTSMRLGRDGVAVLVGPAFRAGRLERFGEAFMHRAAACLLGGDSTGVRQAFLDAVHLLRTGGNSLEDLCVHVSLHKSPAQYRRGGTHEEPYEVLLSAGIRSWRVGQRIRYFRARGGEARLLQEGIGLTAADADTEYYVQRLCNLYCQQFAQAFRREDFLLMFRLPSGLGPYEADPAAFAEIHPIATPA